MSEAALLLRWGEPGAIAALLLAGHALADFVFQTRGMVRHKESWAWLGLHATSVLALQALLLLPFLSPRALAAVAGIAISHGLIDRANAALKRRWPRARPHLFAIDQALHLSILALAARWLATVPAGELLWPALLPLDPAWTLAAVILAAYAFNCNGGGTIVSLVLERFRPAPAGRLAEESGEMPHAGRAIGILERLLFLTFVLLGQWTLLGLLLIAQAIVRFRDLEQRQFSEYYLIGTLTSLLVAVASGLVVRLLV